MVMEESYNRDSSRQQSRYSETVARCCHTLYKDIKCLGALLWSDKAEFGVIYI